MDSNEQLTSQDRVDLDMVMGLIGNSLLTDEGVGQINSVMQQAADPSAVLAHVSFQAISSAIDGLLGEGLDVSDKIWTARAGVVDQTLAEVAQVAAGTGGMVDTLNPQVLESAREQVLDLLQEQQNTDLDIEDGEFYDQDAGYDFPSDNDVMAMGLLGG